MKEYLMSDDIRFDLTEDDLNDEALDDYVVRACGCCANCAIC